MDFPESKRQPPTSKYAEGWFSTCLERWCSDRERFGAGDPRGRSTRDWLRRTCSVSDPIFVTFGVVSSWHHSRVLWEAIHEAEPRGIPLARLRRFAKPIIPAAADYGCVCRSSFRGGIAEAAGRNGRIFCRGANTCVFHL